MKKSLVTMAFALATASLIFAAPQAGTPAPTGSAASATTQKTTKHVKKSHKTKKGANPTSAKPAAK